MASTSHLEESDVPWKTAPEYARETLQALGFEPGSRTWERSIEYATKYGLRGSLGINQRPSSIAAGAVYLCGLLFNEKHSQLEMVEVTGISRSTLRKAYHRIAEGEGFSHSGSAKATGSSEVDR